MLSRWFHNVTQAQCGVKASDLRTFKCQYYLFPGGGGEVMTLHDYGYLPPEFLRVTLCRSEIFKYTPLPRSLTFFHGFFRGESIVMQISFVMLIFLLFSNQFLGGRGRFPGANCFREKTAVSGTMYENTEMSCFQRKP